MKRLAVLVLVLSCLAVASLQMVAAATPVDPFPVSAFLSPGGANGANGERLANGSFEEGFNPDGLAHAWNAFFAGRPVTAFYDDTWPAVVYDGSHSQLIEINSIVSRTVTPVPPPVPAVHPKGIVYDPVGHRVLVASRDTNTVVVLNGETLAESHAPIPVGKQPFDLVLDGGTLLVANFAGDSVSVVDAVKLAWVKDIPFPRAAASLRTLR